MSDTLNSGEDLGIDRELIASGGNCKVVLQQDGNLVLYALEADGFWHARWATNTCGKQVSRCAMQGDGNLVLYSSSDAPLWSSGTWGKPGAFCTIQDDENFVVYHGADPIWSSHTYKSNPFRPPPCDQMRDELNKKRADILRLTDSMDNALSADERKRMILAIGALRNKIDALERLIVIKCL